MARLIILLFAASSSAVAFAGSVEAGRATAAPCVACHGEGGAEPIVNYPIIAGQHESYLIHSMRSYKDGTRNNAVMVQQMESLSDIDIENLAAYFAAQPSPLK